MSAKKAQCELEQCCNKVHSLTHHRTHLATWTDENIDPRLRGLRASQNAMVENEDEGEPNEGIELELDDPAFFDEDVFGDDGKPLEQEEEDGLNAEQQEQQFETLDLAAVHPRLKAAQAAAAGEASPPATAGVRRRCADDEPDAEGPRKAAKVNDHSGRPRQGDYDDNTKEVIAMAITLFRCKISTHHVFPEHAMEVQWASEAWGEACTFAMLKITPTPEILRVVRESTYTVYVCLCVPDLWSLLVAAQGAQDQSCFYC